MCSYLSWSSIKQSKEVEEIFRGVETDQEGAAELQSEQRQGLRERLQVKIKMRLEDLVVDSMTRTNPQKRSCRSRWNPKASEWESRASCRTTRVSQRPAGMVTPASRKTLSKGRFCVLGLLGSQALVSLCETIFYAFDINTLFSLNCLKFENC